jgi:hypothetical protein
LGHNYKFLSYNLSLLTLWVVVVSISFCSPIFIYKLLYHERFFDFLFYWIVDDHLHQGFYSGCDTECFLMTLLFLSL